MDFANFRCAIWHKAVGVILESIKGLSKVGYWIMCGDNKLRQVYPRIAIISADYEEAYVLHTVADMTLLPVTYIELYLH